MKIKYDGFKYYGYADYSGCWYPFWEQGHAAILFEGMLKPIAIDDRWAYFSNCGPKCSGLWADPSCGRCGGAGVGKTGRQ